MLEERVADSRPDLVRVHVEVHEPVVVEDREAAAEEVDLALAHAPTEEGEVLLVRVECRQEFEQRERRLVDRDDLLDVVCGRAPDHPPRYVRGSIGIDLLPTPFLTRRSSARIRGGILALRL